LEKIVNITIIRYYEAIHVKFMMNSMTTQRQVWRPFLETIDPRQGSSPKAFYAYIIVLARTS